MRNRIEDYGFIGNLSTGALVSRDGSIDWLCLPHFDSPACFAALLGKSDHGFWRIAPADPYKSTRRYHPGTMILETEFVTSGGRIKLIDGMIPETDRADVVRIVEGVEGRISMKMEMMIRLDYGSHAPWIRYADGEVLAVGGPDMLHLYAPVRFQGDNWRTSATFRVKSGQQIPFVLNWHPSHEKPPPAVHRPAAAIKRTTRWWKAWSKQSNYQGPWKEAVERSLLTLKSLTYTPTGGIVAAPTTSLPEKIGGVRNWDYRYCWLRDATLTLLALIRAGYIEEAKAWRVWLLRAAAGSPADMQIMYGLRGERRLPETELSWLPGYEKSRPVRIGNAAAEQFQLDVYGELIGGLHVARQAQLEDSNPSWQLQRDLIEHVSRVWKTPDEGIWEVRGPRRHFTHSKLMAWVALDRGIKAIESHGHPGPVRRWRGLRTKIHRDICQKGYNAAAGAFVQYFGGSSLDASLLMMPLVGFLPATDPRMRSTIQMIEKKLMHRGFVMRYLPEGKPVDGLPSGEGVFLACSFWLVDNLILIGRRHDAEALFERLLNIRNDLGLLAEEYDPVARRQLGNFPQAFSHVGLINSAFRLSSENKRQTIKDAVQELTLSPH